MALGYLIIGILFGATAAVLSLLFGASALLAFAVYSGVGSISMLLLAGLHFVLRNFIKRKAGTGHAGKASWKFFNQR